MTAEPLSLYFGIEDGQRASLETIARAALIWSDAIKQVAARIDPEIEIRVEFAQTEEGSVWLETLIKALKRGEDEAAVKAVILGILAWFALGFADHMKEDAWNEILEVLGHAHKSEAALSDDDRQKLADDVVRKLVKEVENDPAIKSIGMDRVPRAAPPRLLIERHEFPHYGATPDGQVEAPAQKDTDYAFDVRVTIVRETLKYNSRGKVRWRFASPDGEEWSADIEDDEFIAALQNRQTGLETGFGVEMVFDLAIDKKLVEGVWVEDNRRIIRVKRPRISRAQRMLGLEDD